MTDYGTAVLAQTLSDNSNPGPPPSPRLPTLRRQRYRLSRESLSSFQDKHDMNATTLDSSPSHISKGTQHIRQVRIVSGPGHEHQRPSSFGHKSRPCGFADSRPRMASQEMTEV
ncbi:unnamed protein product [Hydatigera taeniaeformis]|uniref:Protein FAM122A-like n=1 Tax=Hydatigena taeniaeformis TaxID=6205 RepID=A0A0R3X6N1_HYDTA|nr:unnamed protein product [Hydatigera taeniaeformis]